MLATAREGEELASRIKDRYPDHRLEPMLTMPAMMLYPPQPT